MVAINRTIGLWTEEALAFRQELQKYVFEDRTDLLPQDAALPHDKCHFGHPRWWEYCTTLSYLKPHKGQKILDIGGLNNVLGWFMAERYGCEVWQVGLSPKDIDRYKKNHQNNKHLPVIGQQISIENFKTEERFDSMLCISVFEHLMYEKQASSEKAFLQSCCNLLKPGGLFCITFDYADHGEWKTQQRSTFLKSEEDINKRIIEQSGLNLVGDIDYKTIWKPEMGMTCERGQRKCSTGIILLQKGGK